MTDLLTALEAAQYRSFCEKYSDIAAPLDRALRECVHALTLRTYHDDDCLDATEKFKTHEMCECGASVVNEALTELRRVLEGEK